MVFKEGDLVILVDPKGSYFLQRLTPGKRFHTHRGYIDHDQIIGAPAGTVVKSSLGREFLVFYPSTKEYTLNMPRKSGIIYPKDVATILVWADIFPGARVLCGGVGSGALLIAVLRQVGPTGRVVAYDVREDMLAWAEQNAKNFLGELPGLELKLGDIYEPIPERNFDRVLLDVPEPWRALDTVEATLLPGGIFSAYVPSIVQVDQLVKALEERESFALIESLEVLVRHWQVEGKSVRPYHRMVGHTGFLVFARKVVRSPGESC
ncbi:tRNA (adenine-N1)-methyltransferase [Ammonifex thiophilus]|uniref:tRNA (adenine(58)-N(1))-methyltransferase TrmI n=1 Tax=Ammonifex thiophilus TaxID=444093 RepID=A0A3D8P465_9THEO|nr:tRNA (adenine-N1)-methyltransferase [Ammonifex thiophilus]RDV82883.1 tRNA (adenine-N1)-methyltransferase [Ammonifex thiophilus]